MIYIDENSKIVQFPKISDETFNKIHFVNQVTNESFDLFVSSNLGNEKYIYTIDITPVLSYFETGQYDYSFQKNDGTIVSSGILQFDSYTNTVVEYNNKPKTIQYTPGETNYVEVNRTINITENDTYNVEDYDTAVVNVKGSGEVVSGGGNLSIASVFTKGYTWHHDDDLGHDIGDNTISYLYFNLTCDVKTAFEKKDTTYFTISRYNQLRKKYCVLNDEQGQDERFKMYCWAYKNDEDWKRSWTYFYTMYDYDDDVQYLFEENPDIWAVRCPYVTERWDGSWWFENNYATNLNQLVNNGFVLDEHFAIDDSESIVRCPEHDIDNYFVSTIGKNPMEKFCEDFGYSEEDFYEIPYSNAKYDFMYWLEEHSFLWRGNNKETDEDLYAYTTFCDDVPIKPIKLADCYVSLTGELARKYASAKTIYEVWKKFGDLDEEDLELLENPVFKSPYTGNEILARLYTLDEQWDFWYRSDDWKQKLYTDYLLYAKRRSSSRQIYSIKIDDTGGFSFYLRFGLCNEKQLKSGNYNGMPTCNTKLVCRGAKNMNYYNSYDDELLNCAMIKVVQ